MTPIFCLYLTYLGFKFRQDFDQNLRLYSDRTWPILTWNEAENLTKIYVNILTGLDLYLEVILGRQLDLNWQRYFVFIWFILASNLGNYWPKSRALFWHNLTYFVVQWGRKFDLKWCRYSYLIFKIWFMLGVSPLPPTWKPKSSIIRNKNYCCPLKDPNFAQLAINYAHVQVNDTEIITQIFVPGYFFINRKFLL